MDSEVFSLEDDGYGDMFITQESRNCDNNNDINGNNSEKPHVKTGCSQIYENISDVENDQFEDVHLNFKYVFSLFLIFLLLNNV